MRCKGRIRPGKKAAILLIFALLAGMVNGLIGTGGGVIVVFLLRYLLKGRGYDARDVFAGAICVILPFTVFSAACYLYARNEILGESLGYLFPAALGGLAGGFLLGKLKLRITKKIFAALLILSGILMFLR